MDWKRLFNLLKHAFKEWSDDRAPVLGAALAYYTIFSIGPLLVAVIGITGLVLGPDAASGHVADTLKGFLGEDGAKTVQSIIAGASKPTEGIIATIIGSLGVVFGAMAIFGQLKNALNVVWDAPKKKGGIGDTIVANIAMFALVIASGLVLLLSLAANALIATLQDITGSALPGGPIVWQLLNYVVSLGLVTLTFAIIFKALPDVRIAWEDVWLGSFITSILFMVGQILIGLYLAVLNVGSAFGAAGSLVVILVWVYFSAQITFLGAEITQVYANMYGSKVGEKKEWALKIPGGLKWRGSKRRAGAAAGDSEERTLKVSPWFGSRD
ncbi:MAG TPA: YihY/virulence factor BrkB family protein [Chloroflexia bacterium]|nr:YihY/virulence factor BrkB family protein [Chloroflexia bacterium]